jgi:mono/diheme cytochrome c family protein
LLAAGLLLLAATVSGCAPDLPEPESPGARLYAGRCGGCHRLYAPSVMTAAMWRVMVERMQAEFGRRGLAPLSAAESAEILAYLDRHAQGASTGPGPD